jgi:hypothetical protein
LGQTSCFSKKEMSQDLNKISFSHEYKKCVDEFYSLLLKSDCDTIREFGKIMESVPHEKKSATFLYKLRKLVASKLKQKGGTGKVIINGNNTTEVNDNIIQGVGLKGAISSFLKNIVDYENPGSFDDSTKNLFRMLHTLYSNNMNIFVIIMTKIMKKIYGTKFEFVHKVGLGNSDESDEPIAPTVVSNATTNYKPSGPTETVDAQSDKSNGGLLKGGESKESLEKYYKKLKKMKEEKNIIFNKETTEKYITKGEILILEMIMKEVEHDIKNNISTPIKKFESQRIMANIALTKPPKSKLLQEKINLKNIQKGGNMEEMDKRNFEIIYEKYDPWVNNLVKNLDEFIVKLTSSQGFKSLKRMVDTKSIITAIDNLGDLADSALAMPTFYMGLSADIMEFFGADLSDMTSPSEFSESERLNNMQKKLRFYLDNITAFHTALSQIITCMVISSKDGEEGREKLLELDRLIQKKYPNIKRDTVCEPESSEPTTSTIPTVRATPMPTAQSNTPTVRATSTAQASSDPTQILTNALTNTVNNTAENIKSAANNALSSAATKVSESVKGVAKDIDSKIYDLIKNRNTNTREAELFKILNRRMGDYLPPEEQKIDTLRFLFETSGKIIDDINSTDTGDENVIERSLTKIRRSIDNLRDYLISNKEKIMKIDVLDSVEIAAIKAKVKAKLLPSEAIKTAVKVKTKAQDVSKQLQDIFNKRYEASQQERITKGGGVEIGGRLADVFFNNIISNQNLTKEDILAEIEKLEKPKLEKPTLTLEKPIKPSDGPNSPKNFNQPNGNSPIENLQFSPTNNTPSALNPTIQPTTTTTNSPTNSPALNPIPTSAVLNTNQTELTDMSNQQIYYHYVCNYSHTNWFNSNPSQVTINYKGHNSGKVTKDMNAPTQKNKLSVDSNNLTAKEIIEKNPTNQFGIVITQFGGVPLFAGYVGFYNPGGSTNTKPTIKYIPPYKGENEVSSFKTLGDWIESNNDFQTLLKIVNHSTSKWGFTHDNYDSRFQKQLNFETKQNKNYHDEEYLEYVDDTSSFERRRNYINNLFSVYNDSWLIKDQSYGSNKVNIVFTTIPNIYKGELTDGKKCIFGRTYNEDIDKENIWNPRDINNLYWTGVRSGILSALLTLDQNNCSLVVLPVNGLQKTNYERIIRDVIANEYTFQNLKTVYII